MKDAARVVIIGGGVAGASIAWHLAEAGCTDVLLVERSELTSGSTFHSAGLVGQLRGSLPLTRMMMHSVELYRRLEAESEETGRSPGWNEVGSLRIASTPERLEELTRQHGWAKTFGLPMELLGPSEAADRFPLMDPAGVLGAVWLPTDGYLDPSGLTYALIGGAKARGVTVETGVRVTGLRVEHGRVRGVETDHGPIEAETVVAACGMYTPQVAAFAGVNVPIVPVAHQYVITKPIDGVTPDLPQLRDPDNLVYFRRESGGLVLGGYERDPAPWSLRRRAGRLQQQAPPRGLGSIRTAHGQRVPAGPGRRAGRDRVARQRARGVHPRQRVHPRRERRPRVLRRGGVLRARHRGCGWRRPGDGRVDPRRRADLRHLEDGHPSLRSAVPQPRPRARTASSRCTPPTTTSTTRTRSGSRAVRSGAPPRTSDSRHSVARSARRACGSDRTGSSPTPRSATPRSDPTVGRASTGAPPSAPRRSRAATPPRSSTRPASPSSSSPVRARRSSSTGSPPTRWTARSAASRTRSCATRAAASSATSPPRASTTTAICS